jgi:AmpE protein
MMAIHLLVVLLALALLHWRPITGRWRGDGWFRRWVAQLSDTAGIGRVLLAVLVPMAGCAVIAVLLARVGLGSWLPALFALVVLLYALGPRDFETDVTGVLDAAGDVDRESAAQALAEGDRHLPWDTRALGVAVVYAALRRRFGVLFWFFVLGPAGALGYRLAQTLGRDPRLARAEDLAAVHVANAVDWLPAQLLTFTLALVGHWEGVIGAWQRWHSQAATTSWYRSGPGFLGAAAQADIDLDMDGGDGYSEERSDPLAEIRRLRAALQRALLAWLSIVALVVIGSWLG